MLPCVALTDSQGPPLFVVAEAKNWVDVVPLAKLMGCCEMGELLPTVSLTMKEPGLAVSGVAARIVKLTGTTAGLFEAEELIVMEPL